MSKLVPAAGCPSRAFLYSASRFACVCDRDLIGALNDVPVVVHFEDPIVEHFLFFGDQGAGLKSEQLADKHVHGLPNLARHQPFFEIAIGSDPLVCQLNRGGFHVAHRGFPDLFGVRKQKHDVFRRKTEIIVQP